MKDELNFKTYISQALKRYLKAGFVTNKKKNTQIVVSFNFEGCTCFEKPIPVAARSKAQVFGRSPAEIVGSNPTRGMDTYLFVCCECCVFSGRGLCDGLTTRPEGFYRLWRVIKNNA